MCETRKYVEKVKPLSVLLDEYRNPNIREKINHLVKLGFTGFRSVRGDGNCFYSAVAVGIIEVCFEDLDELDNLKRKIGLVDLAPNVKEELENFLKNFPVKITPKTDLSQIKANNIANCKISQLLKGVCSWRLHRVQRTVETFKGFAGAVEAEEWIKKKIELIVALDPEIIYEYVEQGVEQIENDLSWLQKYDINVDIEGFRNNIKQEGVELLPPQVVCQYCDKAGHIAKSCPQITLKKSWFKNQSLLQSLVNFLRMATIHQIRNNDDYKMYLQEGETIKDRCKLIGTMGEEAEHFEINALLTFF